MNEYIVIVVKSKFKATVSHKEKIILMILMYYCTIDVIINNRDNCADNGTNITNH